MPSGTEVETEEEQSARLLDRSCLCRQDDDRPEAAKALANLLSRAESQQSVIALPPAD